MDRRGVGHPRERVRADGDPDEQVSQDRRQPDEPTDNDDDDGGGRAGRESVAASAASGRCGGSRRRQASGGMIECSMAPLGYTSSMSTPGRNMCEWSRSAGGRAAPRVLVSTPGHPMCAWSRRAVQPAAPEVWACVSPPAAPALAASGRVDVDPAQVLARARHVLAIEADAIAGLGARLGAAFVAAVVLILHCRGRVVVSGIGRSVTSRAARGEWPRPGPPRSSSTPRKPRTATSG